jgi:hypothetical protein
MYPVVVPAFLLTAAFAGLLLWKPGDANAAKPKILAQLYYPLDSQVGLQIHDFLQLNRAISYRIELMGPLDASKSASLRTVDNERIDGDQEVLEWLWKESASLTEQRPVRPPSFDLLPFQLVV